MRLVKWAVAIAAGVLVGVNAAVAQHVRIGIPERNNLQYLSFWVAQGAGLFAAEGVDVEIVYADVPNQSGMILMQRRVDISLLQPPVYLGLIAEQHPFALFANLLANDPINLIVRKDVADKLKLDPRLPLADRLRAIKGLRIGVAPEPPRRLRLMFAEAGMNADQDVQMVIRRAEDQTEALTTNVVDALYIHTPVLEDALVRLGVMLYVNQSGGEVAAVANGQIHALGATKEYIAAHPDVITKVTRAIARAQDMIRGDTSRVVDALVKAGIESPSPKHLQTIVDLYRPAIPKTPRVTAAAIERNANLYPARPTMPDFTKVTAADFIATEFAEKAPPGEAAGRFDLGVVEVSVAAPSSDLSPWSHTMNSDTIRRQQALTVKDAIEYLPGVAVDHKAPRNQSGIAIGGFDSRQVPLYIDGIPAYLPFDGYVDLGRYLTSNASEVQVAKGYASPLLGPNVLGGVVNVVSRQPLRNLEGEVFAGTAPGRQVNAGLHIAGRWREVSGSATAERLQSDTFPLAGGFTPTAIQGTGDRLNAQQRDDRYRARVAWAPRPSDLYAVSGSIQRGMSGVPPYAGSAPPCPGNVTLTTPCVTPRYWNWPEWDADSVYLNSRTGLGSASALQLRGFYSRYRNTQEMFDDATFTTMNVNASSGILANRDRSAGVSGVFESHRWSRHDLGVSFFVKHDTHTEQTTTFSRSNVPTITPEQRDRDRQSSFGIQDAIRLSSRVRATAGLSADRLTPLEAQDLAADRTGVTPFPLGDALWVFNPVGSLTYADAAHGTVFIALARKSRFPTMKDRYSYRAGRAVPNPELRPERARTWTAGYSRTIASQTAMQVEWYRSHVTDEIENIFFLSPLCPAAGAGTGGGGGGGGGGGRAVPGTCQQAVNIGAERHYGASLSMRSTALPRMSIDGNYSYLHRKLDSTTAFPMGTPRHKVVGAATMLLPKAAGATITVRHLSGIAAMSDNGLRLPEASFTTMDAGGSIPIRRALVVQAGVKNLFDRDYYYWEGFPEPGRNGYLTLRYTF